MLPTILQFIILINGIGVGLWVILQLVRSYVAGLLLVLFLFVIEILFGSLPSLPIGLNIFAPDIVFIFLLIASVLRIVRRPSLMAFPAAVIWIIFGFCIFGSFVGGISEYGTAAGVAVRNQFYVWVCAFYFMTFRVNAEGLAIWSRYWIWAALAICGIACIRWASDFAGLSNYTVYGAGIAFRVVPAMGAYFVGISAVFAYQSGGGRKGPSRTVLILAFLAVALVLQHKSVWLSTLVAFAIVLVSSGRLFLRDAVIYALIGVVAWVGIMLVIELPGGGTVVDALRHSVSSAVNIGSGTAYDRLAGWNVLLNRWWAGGTYVHFLGFPYGTGTLRTIVNPLTGQAVTQDFSAHSYYVQTLYDVGLIGMVSWISMFLIAAWGIWTHRESSYDAIGRSIQLGLLGSCLAFFTVYQGSYIHGIILGMIVSYLASRREFALRRSIAFVENRSQEIVMSETVNELTDGLPRK